MDQEIFHKIEAIAQSVVSSRKIVVVDSRFENVFVPFFFKHNFDSIFSVQTEADLLEELGLKSILWQEKMLLYKVWCDAKFLATSKNMGAYRGSLLSFIEDLYTFWKQHQKKEWYENLKEGRALFFKELFGVFENYRDEYAIDERIEKVEKVLNQDRDDVFIFVSCGHDVRDIFPKNKSFFISIDSRYQEKKMPETSSRSTFLEFSSPVEEVQDVFLWVDQKLKKQERAVIIYFNYGDADRINQYLKKKKIPILFDRQTSLNETSCAQYILDWLSFWRSGFSMEKFFRYHQKNLFNLSEEKIESIFGSHATFYEQVIKYRRSSFIFYASYQLRSFTENKRKKEWQQFCEDMQAPWRHFDALPYCFDLSCQHTYKIEDLTSVVLYLLDQYCKKNETPSYRRAFQKVLEHCPQNITLSLADFERYLKMCWMKTSFKEESSCPLNPVYLVSLKSFCFSAKSSVCVLGASADKFSNRPVHSFFYPEEEPIEMKEAYQKQQKKRESLFREILGRDFLELRVSFSRKEHYLAEESGRPATLALAFLGTPQLQEEQSFALDLLRARDKRTIKYPFPKNISVTGILQLIYCPRRFFVSQILKIPQKEHHNEVWMDQRLYGILLHQAFENIVLESKQNLDRTHLYGVGEKILRRWCYHRPAVQFKERFFWEKKYREAFSQFFDVIYPWIESASHIDTEKIFRTPLDDLGFKGCILKGQMDALVHQDDQIILVDYKTGRCPSGPIKGVYKLQLLLYLWMHQRQQKTSKKLKGVLLYQEGMKDVSWSQDQDAWVRSFLEAVNDVFSENYFPVDNGRSKDLKNCLYCSFPKMCQTQGESVSEAWLEAYKYLQKFLK